MNCSLFTRGACLSVLLFSSVTVFARWEVTNFDKRFTFIAARNGMLVGIEETTRMPFKWEKPVWKKLGDQEFVYLATNGTTIAGIKQSDKNAYIFVSSSWQKIGSQLGISFKQLVFDQQQLLGCCQDPAGFVFAWNNSSWRGVGIETFWNFDAAGAIICGVVQAYEDKNLNYQASQWHKKDWQNLGKKQFKQLVTNGTRIVGIEQPPKMHVFEWTGKQWQQLGTEKLTQLAIDKNILCGIQEKIQLILVWNGQRWLAYDTKKFIQAVTDGNTVYGLANDKRVYYWTSR